MSLQYSILTSSSPLRSDEDEKGYLNDYQVNNLLEAKELLETVFHLYNDERPHMSIGMLTPNQVHENKIDIENIWKTSKCKTVNLF